MPEGAEGLSSERKEVSPTPDNENILTPVEIAYFRYIGVRYVSRDLSPVGADMELMLWDDKPVRDTRLSGHVQYIYPYGYRHPQYAGLIGTIELDGYPTKIRRGCCIHITDDGTCEYVDDFPIIILSEKELELCKLLGADYVTRESCEDISQLQFWDGKPERCGNTYMEHDDVTMVCSLNLETHKTHVENHACVHAFDNGYCEYVKIPEQEGE